MKKYVLISVVEFDINTETFDTVDEALAQMKKEYSASCHNVRAKSQDGDANLEGDEAWVHDGYNHDNYSWKIIRVSADDNVKID